MSLSKKDRKIQSNLGNDVPRDGSFRPGAAGFAVAISEALHREFEGNASAVKTIAKLTGANERAVKNWYDGKNGPSGEFLVILCRHSEQVFEAVLTLSGRNDVLEAKQTLDVKKQLMVMLKALEKHQAGETPES